MESTNPFCGDDNRPLILVRPHLEEIPRITLPPDFLLRPIGWEDEPAWLTLVRAAETFIPIADPDFERAYGQDSEVMRSRVFFAETAEGVAAATVGAWYGVEPFIDWGRIHWLYVHPKYQGRGLGKALLSLALLRLKELGHTRAYLKTSSGRTAALSLYSAFGFSALPRVEPQSSG